MAPAADAPMRVAADPPGGSAQSATKAVVQFAATGMAAVALLGFAAVRILQHTGEREAIRDAKHETQLAGDGAIGYLLKDAEPAELLRGIRAAARGEAPLDPKAASAVLSARSLRRPEGELSERQRAVLALVAEGKQNKHIARELEITEKTVKTHLTAIFHILGVTDRTQAALWTQRRHITRAG